MANTGPLKYLDTIEDWDSGGTDSPRKTTDFKALGKRRRKLTQVEDLGQLATSFG